jgi:uncharacterized Zn-binding protein involved in type VI secretion
MGKPAARIGDSTAHGGSIVTGCPTVTIGGVPAARMGDMTVCPLVTPGTPPIPHVGGSISIGSTGVNIGGMPAARVGDMATCVGPPSSIAVGCPTVMIGEARGGGGGGGGGNSATGLATSAAMAGNSPLQQTQDHFIDFQFVDSAGLPVGGVHYDLDYPDGSKDSGVLTGLVQRGGVPQGNYTFKLRGIVNAQWSTNRANVGTAVNLIVDTVGVDNGETAILQIFVRDTNYSDHLLETIEAQVNNDQVQVAWTMQVDDDLLELWSRRMISGRYSKPFFFFRTTIAELFEQSNFFVLQTWVEIKALQQNGNSAANEPYIIRLANGQILCGNLDGNGQKRINDVIPSLCEIEFPTLPNVVRC